MKRALLIAALIALAAVAAHADIRALMRAKGYSSIPAQGGACSGNCGGAVTIQDSISEPVSPNVGCTFPATFPCTMN